jgi:type II secretory pathway component PulJ
VSRVTRAAFTLVEILVVVALLALIVLALMMVFNSTQTAFRNSLTQTDVLESGRAAMGLIADDLAGLTPSFGQSNGMPVNGYSYTSSNAPINFCVVVETGTNTPFMQPLIGSSNQRTNVLETFFVLTRQNTTWTGVGYAVNPTSPSPLYPLYRFSLSTNVLAASPVTLYNAFIAALASAAWTNLSHLADGAVDLRVRAFDTNSVWMTNGYVNVTNLTVKNVQFLLGAWGETGFYMFSNALPAAVEIELGVLEDRTLQRAESLANNPQAQMAYLSNHVGQLHLFRQRVLIRNVDPAAYQ